VISNFLQESKICEEGQSLPDQIPFIVCNWPNSQSMTILNNSTRDLFGNTVGNEQNWHLVKWFLRFFHSFSVVGVDCVDDCVALGIVFIPECLQLFLTSQVPKVQSIRKGIQQIMRRLKLIREPSLGQYCLANFAFVIRLLRKDRRNSAIGK